MSDAQRLQISNIILESLFLLLPIYAAIRYRLCGALLSAVILWLIGDAYALLLPPRPTSLLWMLFGWLFTLTYALIVYGAIQLMLGALTIIRQYLIPAAATIRDTVKHNR